ncbi:MAG TPA: PIN domain-containing protein [Blastocatellia bacterium]|nr:PIN domain-containing protein [Blastocatellia bacterium]HMV83739.1 PIN domain-containing protein [Blastocatellia bacterium]HMX26717.1 PIN domain-containing protein [Blastocatellia bacterium]HMY73219.1 PIN domain-containing protein [Blastocatellia bacterium]HMZ20451.1 PIN domain-containing protein [Blastocatellia bacterium]
MIAFDTNVLTEILLGASSYVTRASAIPVQQQAVPIIVIEEIIRGRLNVIRQAEAGKAKIALPRAYELFQETFSDARRLNLLSYTSSAELLYQQWRAQRLRISTHDLRIAAICVAHNAILVTRNRRDFEPISGLTVEFW